jgi:pimeloyl-ACP methyl ester carboxylesterase
MEMPKPLPGVTSHMVKTPRLTQHILRCGPADGVPVIFLHGNFSAALYWEETMLALPAGFQGIAPDLRGYGWTEDLIVDATRGMADWTDDLLELMAALGLAKAHFVGWSMGAGIIYDLVGKDAGKVLSATLVDPVPTYGFGGTRGPEGTPCFPDFAGSGGGLVNPTFAQRIMQGDYGSEDPNSPRNVINGFYYKPPFLAAREEDFLIGAMMEKMGSERYPGNFEPSANWPNVAPGDKGPLNAASARYMAGLAEKLVAAPVKPPVLWVRGSHDMIVGDASMFDIGNLGKMGFIPGWPGDEVYPPQPMVLQMRHVLDQYAAAGGSYAEHVIPDTAHGPHIEKPADFAALFHPFLRKTGK